MRIALLTTDARDHYKQYGEPTPFFGTAPQALLEGFASLSQPAGKDILAGACGDPLEVHVVCCAQQKMKSPEKLANNIFFHSLHVPKINWMRTGYLGCIHAVRKALHIIQPDIVHAQGTERDCAMTGAFSGYPNVLTIHGNMRIHATMPATRRNLYYKVAALLEYICLRKTAGVFAISTYTRDLVSPYARRVWLLPNAVDPSFYAIAPRPPPIPRILFVGTFCERKNAIGLLEACAPYLKANLCSLVFAGSGSPESEYYQRFQSLAGQIPNVELVGFLDRDALRAEFEQSSFLVLPTFEDNCPMVVLEAQAAGLPVAASSVGGVPDLIRHRETGILFNPNHQDAIRDAVHLLLNDPLLRAELGVTARDHARATYLPAVVARRHLEIYREVLGSTANG